MNLKVRMKNWSFWVSIAISVVTPILAYFGMTAADVTTWAALWNLLLQALSNPYVIGLVVASVYNTVVDPTTPGIKDSERARSYTTPGGDDE